MLRINGLVQGIKEMVNGNSEQVTGVSIGRNFTGDMVKLKLQLKTFEREVSNDLMNIRKLEIPEENAKEIDILLERFKGRYIELNTLLGQIEGHMEKIDVDVTKDTDYKEMLSHSFLLERNWCEVTVKLAEFVEVHVAICNMYLMVGEMFKGRETDPDALRYYGIVELMRMVFAEEFVTIKMGCALLESSSYKIRLKRKREGEELLKKTGKYRVMKREVDKWNEELQGK